MRRSHLALLLIFAFILAGVFSIVYFDTLIAPYTGLELSYPSKDCNTTCPPCTGDPALNEDGPQMGIACPEPVPCPECPKCEMKSCPLCEKCEKCEQCPKPVSCPTPEPPAPLEHTPVQLFLDTLDKLSNVYEPNPTMDLVFSPYKYDFPELAGRKLPSQVAYRLMMGHRKWIDDNEQHVQQIFRQYAWGLEDCLILDVGANDGQYTHLSAGTGCAVVAFELQPTCLEYLHTAVFINNQTSRVRIINRAVHHEETHLDLSLIPNECNGGLRSGKRRVYWDPQQDKAEEEGEGANKEKRMLLSKVPTVVLNRALIPPHLPITLLKVDTEGHEPEILQGAMELFRSKQVKHALVEIFPFYWSVLGKEIGFAVFTEILEAGYSITCLGRYASNLNSNQPIGKVVTWTLENKDDFVNKLKDGFRGYTAANVCVDYHIQLIQPKPTTKTH